MWHFRESFGRIDSDVHWRRRHLIRRRPNRLIVRQHPVNDDSMVRFLLVMMNVTLFM